MVRAALNKLQAKWNALPEERWVYVAQILTGLFFIGAATFKTFSFIILNDQHLKGHFQYWISMGLPPGWYKALILWMFTLPYGEEFMETSTILLQLIPGFLLLINKYTRLAGFLLLYIQSLVFLGTFFHLGFNEFVGLSIWIALYFALRPSDLTQWKPWAWKIFRGGIIVLFCLYLYNRYHSYGDAWPSNMVWQQAEFKQEVMSIHPLWKQLNLYLFQGEAGHLILASFWWIHLACVILLFTRYRLYAGAVLLSFAIYREITWTNAITSQGVLTVLLLFLWLTQEELLMRKSRFRNSLTS
jgi:hypothetical protein